MTTQRITVSEAARRLWANRPSVVDVLVALVTVLAIRFVFGIPVLIPLVIATVFFVAITALITIRELNAERGDGGDV